MIWKPAVPSRRFYVGQGSQTGRIEDDPPKYDCAYNSKRPKYFHSVSMLTFIQGKPGEPGSEGLQGPKGSRVNLFCVHNPVLATHKIHEVMFDVLFCLDSLIPGGTWHQWTSRNGRARGNHLIFLCSVFMTMMLYSTLRTMVGLLTEANGK